MSAEADVRLLRRHLAEVERRARALPWSGAPEDTWRTATYVRTEDGLPLVDLHDLDRDLALVVCDTLNEHRNTLRTVRLVTGRGRRSENGKAVLRTLVRDRLRADGWSVDETGAGHLDVHPSAGRIQTGGGFWKLLLRLLTWLMQR